MSDNTNAPTGVGASLRRLENTTSTLTPLGGALWLVRHGFPVFPCDHPALKRCAGLHRACDGSRGKHPAVAFTRAWTLDERKVHETFARGLRNPAVAVGACSGPQGAQLLVIDSDRPGAIEDVAAAHGEEWPATMRVLTAKGHHDYLWAPRDLKLGNGLGTLQGRFDGDVRAGNAYVIAPGAQHASGALYRVYATGQPPVMAPGWLLRALLAKPTQTVRRTFPRPGVPDASRRVLGLVKFVTDSATGDRNNRLFWAACRAAEDGQDAQGELLAAAIETGLDEREALATIQSAYKRTGATA